MISVIDKKKCCGCHACYNICPNNCISMVEDNKGFKYPVVDKDKCIDCKLCEKTCPINNSNNNIDCELKAYAAYNKNRDIRLKSSSGGIFTALAEYILDNKRMCLWSCF